LQELVVDAYDHYVVVECKDEIAVEIVLFTR